MFKFFKENNEIAVLEKIKSPVTEEIINLFLTHVQHLIDKKPLKKSDMILFQNTLFIGLNKIYSVCSSEEWKTFKLIIQEHPVKNILHECPLTRRSFEKPRGYSGDAIVLDFIYFGVRHNDLKVTTDRGKMICDSINETPASRAVRNRARKIGLIIDTLPVTTGRKLKILSIACGHMRELSTSKRFMSGECEVVGLDQDIESLKVVRQEYGYLGVQTVNVKIKKLLTDSAYVEQFGQFDFVYASGLLDYLNDKTASQLMKVMYAMTKEEGLILFTNFAPNISRAYMETFMEWDLIYRTPYELLRLSENAIPAFYGKFYEDPSRGIVFLEFRKPLTVELQPKLRDIEETAPMLTSKQNVSFVSYKSKL